jgi:hypothetical protein
VLNDFRFVVVSDEQYAIKAGCSGNATAVSVKTVDLPSGITISSTPSPVLVKFKALGQGTNLASGATATLTLAQTGTGNQATITVTSGGEIK